MACPVCEDVGWVCENHRDTPWREPRKGERGCECGAGDPCPACNSLSGERPRMEEGFTPHRDRDKGPIH